VDTPVLESKSGANVFYRVDKLVGHWRARLSAWIKAAEGEEGKDNMKDRGQR
jgi:hypothetical protein